MKTKVLVTFATEDMVTPDHDMIIKKLCSGLSERGITGGFHVTGDYIRALRKRNRYDVVAALKEHEIGYHSNTHACYPFGGYFGEQLPWDEAVANYMLSEAKGIEDIIDITGRVPAYVVIEFLKVPQLVEAYRKLGLRFAGLCSGMPNSPSSVIRCTGMYAYAGPLFGMEHPPYEGRVEKGLADLKELLETEPPAVKIFLHPYKLLYDANIQAWYGENNFYRHYDPAMPWRIPELARYSPEVTEQLTNEFFALLDLAADFGVEFVTTSDHLSEYVRPAGSTIPRSKADDLWNSFCQNRTYIGNFTPAEITAMRCFALNYPDAEQIPVRTVAGPAVFLTPDPAATVKETDIYFEYKGRMPEKLPPELYVCDLPVAAEEEAEFRAETWTRDIYPAGFEGRQICRLAKLQSWSFAPLVREK